MHSILFAVDGPPLLPIMAAACAQVLGKGQILAAVAAASPEIDAAALDFLAENGRSWHGEVLSLEAISFAPYDLVVCFGGHAKPCCPSLPGNPAAIHWLVGETASAATEILSPGYYQELYGRINQLVEDLLAQGYLAVLSRFRKNSDLILENLQEGILAHDSKRRIFFFNAAAERITGFGRDEVIGKDCHEVFAGGFCQAKCSFCNPGFEIHLPAHPYLLNFRSRPGETRQLEMSLVSVYGEHDEFRGVVASFRDVSRKNDADLSPHVISQFNGLIGRDQKMQEIYRIIRELADADVPALIQGESGTGKELAAAAIHNEGKRKKGLFVPVNCGALPENLLETELFGHVRGAFSGAIRDKKGRFELADGGTIFLDEIGDISPAMQVKLLRVLQDGSFQRVGGEETVQVDVRIISATHKDLRLEIESGRFREDLYYRLCVVPFVLPSLRERAGDIPLLTDYFLKRFLKEEDRHEVVLAPETMDILCRYHWPGNVRELQNVIRYLLVRCRESLVRPHHLPENLLKKFTRSLEPLRFKQRTGLTPEKVRQSLAAAGGNRVKAARDLGVGRATLYRFLEKYSIS